MPVGEMVRSSTSAALHAFFNAGNSPGDAQDAHSQIAERTKSMRVFRIRFNLTSKCGTALAVATIVVFGVLFK